jgi:beta-galactosidase
MMFQRLITAVSLVCFFTLTVSAEFYPERMYKERKKVLLDNGWKFYKGTPSGDPSTASFSDASWQTVNIPHSASYDEPTFDAELNHYKGIVWYRKTFSIPDAPHTGKLILEFEGAMQSADVWLNGQKVGAHYTSGYTWFPVDISGKTIAGNNVLAIKLDNTYKTDIPPGNVGNPAVYSSFPDYHLFSGLYRDVWLICTDKISIPPYGQRITPTEMSAASAKVRIKTVVQNSDAAAKEVVLRYVITDSSNTTVLSEEVTADIPAGQSYTFDKTSGPIQTPKLWSTASPYLYKVYTRVLVNGAAVDDYVERFGIRWCEYSLTEGFKLNGVKTLLQASCLHQSFAWIENALPNSRFFEEVKLIKDMGSNMIRCAHFPRDPSFYNACDELGILSYVEVPTWGVNTPSYPPIFWARLDTCVREMIEVGYNHPSILMWGLFNEPAAETGDDFLGGITRLNNTAHALDSTRLTVMANTTNQTIARIPDIMGVNYWADVATKNPDKIRINTEYHEGWIDYCSRCDARETEYANTRWDKWVAVRDLKDENGSNSYIGGSMWSFNDYSSVLINQEKPMGVVDFYRIPKQVFYLFRKNWTGKAEDNPVAGVTGTRISLEPDLTALTSDSCDISRVIAAIRNDNGQLAGAVVDVTFQVTGPANVFGPTTLSTKCGKIAIVVKSTNTPGTIKIKALAANFAPDSITITSAPRDTTPLPFIAPVIMKKAVFGNREIQCIQHDNALYLMFPAKPAERLEFALYNLQGRRVACPVSLKDRAATIVTSRLNTGYYCLHVKTINGHMVKQYSFIQIR